jgi:hypothetical protein
LALLLVVEGLAPEEAFRRLTLARGLAVPDTPDQVRWVERFAATHQASGSLQSQLFGDFGRPFRKCRFQIATASASWLVLKHSLLSNFL